jgi:hypothetical protein
MIELKNKIVVQDIAGSKARLKTTNDSLKITLSKMGFLEEAEQLIRIVTDDGDRKALISSLIDMDALFSTGKDWSPAELVDYYYEQGIIKKPYKTISWRAPDDYFITIKGNN